MVAGWCRARVPALWLALACCPRSAQVPTAGLRSQADASAYPSILSRMEHIILQILERLRSGQEVDDRELLRITHAALKLSGIGDSRAYAKRLLTPYYERVKATEPERWKSWDITPELERRLLAVLRVKPRRTASGVAPITVITKPWPCSGACRFCPSDVRMPKSYLSAEPACERAKQNYFDPYLQVRVRLAALARMGHATDKVELIVLGGTWSDYPEGYQLWFARELFRALNDADDSPERLDDEAFLGRLAHYERGRSGAYAQERTGGHADARAGEFAGPSGYGPALADADAVAEAQRAVTAGELSYNAAVRRLYGAGESGAGEHGPWEPGGGARAAREDLEREQRINETARHRVVGLVVETRPDAATPEALTLIRRLGATKVQMGVQSTSQRVLDINHRGVRVACIEESFELLRAFGFKIHAHAMVNLLGSTPREDIADYRRLVSASAFQPDEIKLYPCALIESAPLARDYASGAWCPYTEDELVDVLVADVLATPAFCRISRMIRDFAAKDIVAGNKKSNLRQLIDERMREAGEASSRAAGKGDGRNFGGALSPGSPASAGLACLPAAGPDDASSAIDSAAAPIREIRSREVALGDVDVSTLTLDVLTYETTNTSERFLQWVTPEGRIAGFLRLSLPREDYLRAHAGRLPVRPGEAMIREVHVYGTVSRLGEQTGSAQHLGLGRALVERACELAREAGYGRINVISAVGARAYYRRLGFVDNGLYQQRVL